MSDLDPTEFFNKQNPGVSFQEQAVSSDMGIEEVSGMTLWLINHSGGLIQTKKTATTTFIAIFALCVILAVLFLWPRDKEVLLNIDPITGQEIIPGQSNNEI